jgi:hypothetical protein
MTNGWWKLCFEDRIMSNGKVFFPLSREAKRGMPSNAMAGGVNTADITVKALASMSAGLTHPNYASLVDPLFGFAGKRVAAIILCFEHP